MRRVDQFPHRVRHVEHTLVPTRDGTRLAARLWIPDDVIEPVPALLEFIPYRKRDMTRARDALAHPYFAGHGFASVRVDLRGSGDSEGILTDEYLEQEQLDAMDIMAWLEEQPWCNGRVGMFGISWGGFNALQVAALRPPQLGAIISVCSTDDRYADDVHYMGGCLLGDNLSWASTMFAYNSCPPDPALVPEWRERWLARMERSGLWLDQWLRHQRRDEYYEHGSVCENYDDVQVPVLAVSGWADGYTNGVFRMLENLSTPCWGLIGPWGHAYPHIGSPGPAIGFLQESVRFWERWLSGTPNGYEATPALRAYMQGFEPPSASYESRHGRWVALGRWPVAPAQTLTYSLRPGLLVESDEFGLGENEHVQTILSPLTLGQFAGKWCSYTATPDLPGDQREEDGGALVYDSPPLEAPIEIVGRPEVALSVRPSVSEGTVAIRLSDVAPGGEAYRVTYGVLNLTHRVSHAEPESLEPGETYRIMVRLNGIAHRFAAGNRVRLAISTSYWPLIWTPKEFGPLAVIPESSTLTLPLNPGISEERGARTDEVAFEPSEAAPPLETWLEQPGESNWEMRRNLANDRSAVEVTKDDGATHIPEIDLTIRNRAFERYEISPGRPYSAVGHTHWTRGFERGPWRVSVETRTTLKADAESFIVDAELDAWEADRRVYAQNYHRVIPRDHV